MTKRNPACWKMSVLVLALLAVPVVASAARLAGPPPTVTYTGTNVGVYPQGLAWNPVVDYTLPNFAQSPNIRKFVDSLPGLGATNANNLGQYIPVAVPDTTSYQGDATGTAANPASDYYQIEVKEYSEQLNSDLPPTTLRGYAQINGPAGAPNGVHHNLGPAIIAKSYDPTKPTNAPGNGKPVRIKFINNLTPGSLLSLPVDTTIMGAGMGPLNATELYSQNRVTMHLHGGATPWISDGTPHQWITPAGEVSAPGAATLTSYPKGASFANVPDMVNGSVVNGAAVPCKGGTACFTPAAADGIGTYYYSNEQSARLMFYHDHAYGITRLNVYNGMAAPYLLYDQFEEDMIAGTGVALTGNTTKFLPDQSAVLQGPAPGAPVAGGGVYRYGIPLVIQDRFFVNDPATGSPSTAALAAFDTMNAANGNKYVHTAPTLTTDPLWAYYAGTAGGNLWLPHEYMPIENPFDPTGNTPNGRWDYAAFMIPPALPTNLTLPSPTLIPETFADTMTVNGTAFPYATLPPDAIRFRILNGCNDRTVNLQLYYAKDYVTGAICKSGNTFTPANCTEVSMVPASPNATYPTWPVDGRDGGVPDPTTAGPPWLQIGNEGGILAKVAVLPQQPIDFEYNRQSIPLAGVTSKTLLILPAVRADVIVDLSKFTAGDVLMVYNDAPAPMPNFWPLNDYYTDDPDQTGVGAAPTTPPGFGPNTRTVMQIRIAGTKLSSLDFSSNAVPGFNRNSPVTGTLPAKEFPGGDGPSLAALKTVLPQVFAASQPPVIVPQLAYNAAYPSPSTHFFPGTADNYVMGYQDTLNISGASGPVTKIKTTAPGNNYIVGTVPTPPTVLVIGGGGSGATATAGLNPIGAVTLLTGGSGYTTPPTVTLGAPDPLVAPAVTSVQATAVATVSGGTVNAITVDEPGANYTNTVTVPTCTVSAPTTAGGVTATCSVMTPTANTVGSIVLKTGGSGYTRQPQVFLIPPTGSNGLGATATAMLANDLPMTGKNLTEGFDAEYGRMDVRLGSTPNPLTPGVGAGFVVGVARYIDPPTEILNDGETIIWRLSHLGVDSHAMHFHLFNMQVVNRVDWTNVLKPPYPEEIGWKETIRTNPMEDLIVAIRPTSMILPFPIANNNRVLDPTTPLNSTTNFYPVAPPAGVTAVAQQANAMTNFGWEYVWHCHLLGHEENDMMRPMVLTVVPPPAPTGLTASMPTPQSVVLKWADTALNPSGFTIQRSTTSTFTPATAVTSLTQYGTALTYTDAGVPTNGTYYYRVSAFNAAGSSLPSNVVTVAVPAAPTNLAATVTSATRVTLTWTDASNNETSFAVWRSANGGALASTTVTRTLAQGTATGGTVTYLDNSVTGGNSYAYYVTAVTATDVSAPTATVTVVTPLAAPTALAANVTTLSSVTLTWASSNTNATGFTVQRYLNAGLTGTPATFTVTGGTTLTFVDTTVVAGTRYWYRVAAFNATSTSPYSTTVNLTVAISFVQVASTDPQGSVSTVTATFPAAQTAGNLNFVAIGWANNTSTVLSVVDNKGNVYAPAVGPTRGGTGGTAISQSLYYATAKGGAGTIVTVTFSSAVPWPDLRIAEYSGGVVTLDKAAGAAGTGTACNSGSVTTTAANELIVGANYVTQTTTASGTGFTQRVMTQDLQIVEDRVVSAIGSYSATATVNAGNWIMQVATFK